LLTQLGWLDDISFPERLDKKEIPTIKAAALAISAPVTVIAADAPPAKVGIVKLVDRNVLIVGAALVVRP